MTIHGTCIYSSQMVLPHGPYFTNLFLVFFIAKYQILLFACLLVACIEDNLSTEAINQSDSQTLHHGQDQRAVQGCQGQDCRPTQRWIYIYIYIYVCVCIYIMCSVCI